MSRSQIQNQTQVTLRGLPTSLFRELKREAHQKKMSLNQVLLDKILPARKKPREGECSQLLALAGTWSEKRAKDFDQALQEIRKIDFELWK